MIKPKTNKQEILYEAIYKGNVSLVDFPYLSGFRTRVSELRKEGVNFRKEKIEKRNKFGRIIRYQKHILTDPEKAKSIYNRMTRIKIK